MAATNLAQEQKNETKLYITTALVQLLQEKPLEKISIRQVVEKAGVSRTAFYRHFNDLNDVIIGYYEPRFNRLFTDLEVGDSDNKLARVGLFYKDTADDILLAINRGFENLIVDQFTSGLERLFDDGAGEINQRYRMKFVGAGVYAIWRGW
jgi:AcrR family transcriptional regulator